MFNGALSQLVLVTRAQELGQLVRDLNQESIVAVDTESNSLYAYRERVCLIQFSTPGADYLVDPLSIEDLSPLAAVFRNTDLQKVFHAAEYDLICLRRDYGFEFANLFDTMIAAGILGREALGLNALLEAEFNVSLDKRHQRANWGKRPLSSQLLSYAQQDTHYLLPLRNRLRVELRQRGLWPLATEDFRRLNRAKLNQNGNGRNGGNEDNAACWRIRGAGDLSPRQAAVLRELCRYREQVAREIDQPLFKVLGDRTLLAITEREPEDVRELRTVPGMSAFLVQRHGAQLVQAVWRGLKATPLLPPRQPPPNGKFLARLDKLRGWRKATAQAMGVKSEVVLPRDLLIGIAAKNPASMDELSALMSEVPWRFQQFGADILETLS